MGGFITKNIRTLYDLTKYTILISKIVIELAYKGKFLYVPPKTINNRSKANHFIKSLVCG